MSLIKVSALVPLLCFFFLFWWRKLSGVVLFCSGTLDSLMVRSVS